MELVSIALATYNGERFLREMLDSIYNQTYQNIEVITVDDGSVDQTNNILHEYSIKFGLKHYRNKHNLGFVKNFEKALSLCSGKYIALADQDDIWLPEKINTLMSKIGDNLLIHSDAILMDDNNKTITSSYSDFSKKKLLIQTFKKLLFYNNVTGCTALIHRDLLLKATPFPAEIMYHDWWLALTAAKSNSIVYIPDKLMKYRQHQNVSGGAEDMKLKELVGNSILKGFMSDRMDKNLKQLNWFKSINKFYKNLTKEEKVVITSMIDYYTSFFSSKFRLKAFVVYLKYWKLMYPHYSFFTKFLILFTSLIGLGKKNAD